MAKQPNRHPIFQTLKLLRDADPFKSFEMQLTSGKSIVVVNATDILLNPKSDVAFFLDRTAEPYMVNLRSVTFVKPFVGRSRQPSNN
jgi:hypothetical protein